ncbi:MAG TPA: hypothetical protein PLJ78_12300 [Anaerolineae bacterium]|nr:hypothetical protein [Anaerolineae bacterium]
MKSGRSRVNQRIGEWGEFVNHESRITDHGLRITDYGLRITNYELRIAFCVLLLLVGCSRGDGGADAVVGWLEAHALRSERVAAPERMARYLAGWSVVALPESGDAAALSATLHTELPDYVIAWPGVAWDGLRAQPWFQDHYRFLDVLSVAADGLTPLRIYGYTSAPFEQGMWQSVQQSLGTTGVELRALRVNRQRLMPGDPLYITLAWDGDLLRLDAQRLVLRLMDAGTAGASSDMGNGKVYAQVEFPMVDGLPVDLRRDGDMLTSRYILALPGDLPYGDYVLTLTLYRRNAEPIGSENLRLTTLFYPPEVTRKRPVPESEGAWQLGDAVALIGYMAPERVSPGDAFRVTLYWHAQAAVSGDYKVFVHLLDANGMIVAQDDSKPVGWAYPTTQWKPGEYIRDEHVIGLDKAIPRGDYTLYVGMYDAETVVRLEVRDAQGTLLPDSRAMLRVVKVR